MDLYSRMDSFIAEREQDYQKVIKKEREENLEMALSYVKNIDTYFKPDRFYKLFSNLLDPAKGTHNLLMDFFSFDREEEALEVEMATLFQQTFEQKAKTFTQLPPNFLIPNACLFQDRLRGIVTGHIEYVISLEEEQLLCKALMDIFQFCLSRELGMPDKVNEQTFIEAVHLFLESRFLKTHDLKLIEHWILLYPRRAFTNSNQRSVGFLTQGKHMIRNWVLQHRFPFVTYHYIDEIRYVLDEQEFERIRSYIVQILEGKILSLFNSTWKTPGDAYKEMVALRTAYTKYTTMTFKKDA